MNTSSPDTAELANRMQRWGLSERQMALAYRYTRAPAQFRFPPSLHAILGDLLIDLKPTEQYEQMRGWPARSAKAIGAVLINALGEPDGYHVIAGSAVEELGDALDYVCGDDAIAVARAMQDYRLTAQEARLFLVLQRAHNREASRDAIMARLYQGNVDEAPEDHIVSILACKLRAKLVGTRWAIENIYGVGYRLVDTSSARAEEPDCQETLRWYARHVHAGDSLRCIARADNVSPSTVCRRLQTLMDALDTDAEQDDYDRRAVEWLAAHPPETDDAD